jgi:acyl-coenzyme A thioesterase PaaI-like protein
MSESLKTKLLRLQFNCIPCFFLTGAHLTYIADDLREIRLALPLSWMTRNYIGTVFGGSMFAATDPIYMLMLIKSLGPEYIVIDKAASIRFKKLGKETLYVRCVLTQTELDDIKALLETQSKIDRSYTIELTTLSGEVCASIERTVNVRRKERAESKI